MPPQSIQDHAIFWGGVILISAAGLLALELCIRWHQGRGRHRG